MNKSFARLLVAALVVGSIAAFFALDLQHQLTFDALAERRASLATTIEQAPLQAALLFLAIYIAVTALSLPGAAIMTLAAGALFGFGTGTVLASIGSVTGATLAFLAARFVLRDFVQRRFGASLRSIDEGFTREGATYLLALRLAPVFPFFLVNLVVALTKLPTRTYVLYSWIGMLPGTLVFIWAGTQLATIHSPKDILSGGLLAAFLALALFPIVAKRVWAAQQRRRALSKWTKPSSFDFNLIVIGAGSAGLVASLIGSATKAKVALIERERMGGDCLNTGCVPSKALIRTTRLLADAARAKEFGLDRMTASFDFAAVMDRVRNVVAQVEPHDSEERYRGLGVDVLRGEARIVDPWRVQLGDRTLTARAIVVASGAAPLVPNLPGLSDYLTSETIWNLRALPQRLVVLGGGPIGCELAQCFRRLGSDVTIVDQAPRLLTKEDEDAADAVAAKFRAEGIKLVLGEKAERFDGKVLITANGTRIEFDQILLALGRKPRTVGFGLEELGVQITKQGTIEHDETLRSTSIPTIHVAGDVAGPFQFTHVAGHQGFYAAFNALFGDLIRLKADYRVIPWATFTEPEVARVGLSENEAKERGIAVEIVRYGIDDLDRAIADSDAYGFVKLLVKPGSDKILGATIVGPHAGDLLHEFVLAMKCGIGLKKILGTVHAYPTLAEATKYAASTWRKAHVAGWQLNVAARYHRWRRGT
ncbi:FAD-dependent oxidoreductase [Roseiterribacter gracilis]|uniref:Pyridine nucleotide-disulfide oxidoreductase n=1 Tax=Roseiterribacter gracilis TaxID=2812848 RepID=A0A8S8X880_9PROT|nr:pyridine nucleotide-disulfide oxidoreductase [Rhodospirillales bacterium TMPK1]